MPAFSVIVTVNDSGILPEPIAGGSAPKKEVALIRSAVRTDAVTSMRRLEQIFAEHGILAQCTGYPNEAIQGSSLALIHFPVKPGIVIDSPDVASDPACCNLPIREQALKLALLMEDVYAVHGLGSLSTAHTQEDLSKLYAACHRAAERLKAFGS